MPEVRLRERRAKRTGISLKAVLIGGAFNELQYQRVFRSMEQDRADALMVSEDAEHLTNRATIVELATKSRIPATYPYREFVETCGLMAYSIDLADIYRRVANLVDKILRGANPGDIPFYQPTKFELIINLKTANWPIPTNTCLRPEVGYQGRTGNGRPMPNTTQMTRSGPSKHLTTPRQKC